jgi:3-oxoacyl-[acyl-carrier protein] reductase
MRIEEAKVLVTGGSSGIGFDTARMLRERGAKVAICGRDGTKVKEAAAEIGAEAFQADVSREEDVMRMVPAVIEAFGGFAPLVEMPLEAMQRVFATNVFGAMLVARESARHFVAQERGNIINIASTAGQRGYAGGTAYAASKFALSGLTECWRAELRKFNIRVMQVNPSEVQTNFVAASGRELRPRSERKLRGTEIAHAVVAMLEMDDRGFIPELPVWATNPD